MNNINEGKAKIKKRIFIGLLAASIILIALIIVIGVFIYLNKFGNWYRLILLGIVALLSLFIFTVSLGLAGIVMTLWHVRGFDWLKRYINTSINFMFPLALVLGQLLKIPKNLIKSSYIEVNNQLVQSRSYNIPPHKILILAPHCLQKWDCPYKVTADVSNCHHCGRCDINNLIALSDSRGVNLAVVTGGTLARKMVIDYHPMAIVAIACERDLTEGILDTSPLPTLGIINIRPEGPCKNTRVPIDKVEKALDFLLSKEITSIEMRAEEIGEPQRASR